MVNPGGGVTTAVGAQGSGKVGTRQPVSVNAQLAASGLKKLDRLEDRPVAMLKNLLKQDAQSDATERPPW